MSDYKQETLFSQGVKPKTQCRQDGRAHKLPHMIKNFLSITESLHHILRGEEQNSPQEAPDGTGAQPAGE